VIEPDRSGKDRWFPPVRWTAETKKNLKGGATIAGGKKWSAKIVAGPPSCGLFCKKKGVVVRTAAGLQVSRQRQGLLPRGAVRAREGGGFSYSSKAYVRKQNFAKTV